MSMSQHIHPLLTPSIDLVTINTRLDVVELFLK